MYFEGAGVPQDNLRAYLWFTLAAIAGAWALNVSPALIRAGVLPYNPKAPLRGD